jgi:thiol-disulfide isomerase/thioredoxin
MGDQFSRFCDDLKRLAPHISIKKKSDIVFEGPVMVVGLHNNIAYYAIPTHKMLTLFLDALDTAGMTDGRDYKDIVKQIERIELPVSLKLFVADKCPHCPQVIRQIQGLAAKTPLVRLKIINAESFPEQAQTDHIRSVPTLILDDHFRWIGRVDTQELFELCANRDPSKLSADSLRQLVENGDAARVAAMMVESNLIFPALIELLTHPRWSVRLGAMVAAEYLADESAELGLTLCRMLWDQFSELAPQVQGDITHLFGLVDTDVTRANLKTISYGVFDQDVKTAAAEVLAQMEE